MSTRSMFCVPSAQLSAVEKQLVRRDERTLAHERAAEGANVRIRALEARNTPRFWLGLASGPPLAFVGVFVKWAPDARRRPPPCQAAESRCEQPAEVHTAFRIPHKHAVVGRHEA